MKIYVAYKLSGADLNELKLKLIEVDKIIKELGHESFIFIRDIQNWIPGSDPKKTMEEAMKKMKECDAILSIIETKEKGEGMLLETGFMKALGKRVIVASAPNGRGILLKAIADEVFEFKDMEEFKDKLRKVI